jgi:hypothetical protein
MIVSVSDAPREVKRREEKRREERRGEERRGSRFVWTPETIEPLPP